MMDFDFGANAPFLMGILGVVLTGLIALFVVGLRMWQKESTDKLSVAGPPVAAEPAPPASAQPTASTPAASPEGVPAPSPARTTVAVAAVVPEAPPDDMIEQLRLLRNAATGGLTIEIGGQRYAHPRDVREGTHQKILLASLKDFYKFMGQASLADKVPDQLAPGPIAPPATTPLQPLVAPKTLEEIRAEAQRPLRTPSMNPFEQYKVMRQITAVPDLPVLSIAEQIDQVLQASIAGSPWVQRGLHVQSSPTGDVRFMLDGHASASLDELTDPDARAVLQTAIQTWDQAKSK